MVYLSDIYPVFLEIMKSETLFMIERLKINEKLELLFD